MDSPLKWVGSKRLLKRHICSLIPRDHDIYVEPFVGSGAVFFFKNSTRMKNEPKPSKLEVLNDIDGLLVNFYRVIQNPRTFNEFLERLDCTLISRDLFMEYRESNWNALDLVEKAFRMYYIVKTSFGGLFRFNQDGKCNSPFASTPDKKARSFLFKKEPLIAAHNRLRGVVLLDLDYGLVLEKYDSPSTFFYIDPPYKTEYAYNKPFDHELLAHRCKHLKGKFVLSLNSSFSDQFAAFSIEKVRVNYSVTCKPGNNTWSEIIVKNF
nr:DNA adenine methylase [Candidatus Sigynarchaeum springense]MDO8116121.1 DNA adenine methylase [Candidatus Sigynarchaeota archaeon]